MQKYVNSNIEYFNNYTLWYKIKDFYENFYKDILNKYSIDNFWNELKFYFNKIWVWNKWNDLYNLLHDINYINNKDGIIENIEFYNLIWKNIKFSDNWNFIIKEYSIINKNIEKYLTDIIYSIYFIDNSFLFINNFDIKDSIMLLAKWWKILKNWNSFITNKWNDY